MSWQKISMPQSANLLLSKAGVKMFSKTQTLVAILDWFAGFPLKSRVQIIREYWQHLATQDVAKGRVTA
jgi:hypothetical protein